MAKKVRGRLSSSAGRSGEPVASDTASAGQRGLNIMEFCKGFNARTQDMNKGDPCPVVITYYQDKSFTFEIKTPPASF
jgi:large subunit ribosomal protein L11